MKFKNSVLCTREEIARLITDFLRSLERGNASIEGETIEFDTDDGEFEVEFKFSREEGSRSVTIKITKDIPLLEEAD